MRVDDVMKKAIVIEDSVKVKDAAKIMSEKRVGSLIIMKGDKLEGIITERDILKNMESRNKKVKEIMSSDVVIVDPDATLDQAADLMAEHEIKRLPVVDKGNLLGIVTVTDIIANSNTLNENFFFDD